MDDRIVESLDETQFRTRFERHAHARGWPRDPEGWVFLKAGDLRREMAEAFSWGGVHQEALVRRCNELKLGDEEGASTYTPTAPPPFAKKPSQLNFFQKRRSA